MLVRVCAERLPFGRQRIAQLVLFVVSNVVVCRCDPTLTTDLIVVTCLLLLIGQIQQSFSLRCPLYLTVSFKLSLLVIIPFLVDAVKWWKWLYLLDWLASTIRLSAQPVILDDSSVSKCHVFPQARPAEKWPFVAGSYWTVINNSWTIIASSLATKGGEQCLKVISTSEDKNYGFSYLELLLGSWLSNNMNIF